MFLENGIEFRPGKGIYTNRGIPLPVLDAIRFTEREAKKLNILISAAT